MTASAMARRVRTCPSCTGVKLPHEYVCGGCWYTLQPAVRRALSRRDDHASRRLALLHEQLQADVPLRQIQIPAEPPPEPADETPESDDR